MKEYGLYLFDFDNTLYDTKAGIEAILRAALPTLGIEYDPSDFNDYLGMSMDEVFDRNAVDPASYEEFRNKFFEVVRSDAYRGAVPFPDAETTVRELKARGKRIGIVSGKMRYKIENLLTECDLSYIPEVIIGWDETVRHKPDPDPIALGFSYFDVPKEDTLYVGDSANDSLASDAFGIDCAIVDRGDGVADTLDCTYTLESLEELLDW